MRDKTPRPQRKSEDAGGVRIHVLVSGIVQGVMYRASCAREARHHAVLGWVRNLPDGRVEAVFQGSPDSVGRMVQWCRSGPPGARVDHVQSAEESPSREENEFEILG